MRREKVGAELTPERTLTSLAVAGSDARHGHWLVRAQLDDSFTGAYVADPLQFVDTEAATLSSSACCFLFNTKGQHTFAAFLASILSCFGVPLNIFLVLQHLLFRPRFSQRGLGLPQPGPGTQNRRIRAPVRGLPRRARQPPGRRPQCRAGAIPSIRSALSRSSPRTIIYTPGAAGVFDLNEPELSLWLHRDVTAQLMRDTRMTSTTTRDVPLMDSWMRGLHAHWLHKGDWTDEQQQQFAALVAQIQRHWTHVTGTRATPKIHMLTHAVQFAAQHGALGRFTESHIESYHATFNFVNHQSHSNQGGRKQERTRRTLADVTLRAASPSTLPLSPCPIFKNCNNSPAVAPFGLATPYSFFSTQ